jgi:hypothetical protein
VSVPVPAHLDWATFRLVARGVASLSEIDEWSWADLMDANAALDLQDRAAALAVRSARDTQGAG